MAFSETNERCVTLTSSDDEEEQEQMPKIIDAISLQGCNTFTFDEQSEDNENILYPECELKEEGTTDKQGYQKSSDNIENGLSNEHKKSVKEKKRIKPTRLTLLRQNEPKPSTSRNTHGNVVDASNLALQESLFKTKELFDTFLRVCQDQENGPEMEKVVEKLERAYSMARQEYLGSERFQSLLESETGKVNTSNTKPWLNLKLVLDELKFNKKCAPPKLKLGESEGSQDGVKSDDEEPVIECPKKRRHLKKLEKTLRALNLKIKKLEEKEVNLEDEDSSYVKLDRYRAQFIKIYNKVCEIKGKVADADRPYLRKVSFAGTTYPHLNRCIERFYNKRKEFPDFQDIKKLVEIANKQENIEMAPVKVHQMAMNAFKEFGEMLKRLRQYDDYDIIISYLDHQVDPARDSKDLQEQLTKNALIFKKKEQEVIDKYAAEDAGIHSDSDEGSDSKPKKKRKIIIKSHIKPMTQKRQLSSSGSSDDSSDEEDDNNARIKTPGHAIASSGESSGGESRKVTDKGKTLVGKKRFVKRGLKLKKTSPIKKPQLQTVLSSDEGSDSKDNFTNYLGLHSTYKKGIPEEVKSEEESEDEIICIPTTTNSSPKKTEKNSDSDEIKHHLSDTLESDSKKNNSTNKINGTKSQQNNIIDSSDSESAKSANDNISTIAKKDPSRIDKVTRRTRNQAEEIQKPNSKNLKLDSQSKPASRRISVNSDRISLSSDSDVESAERTSADESEFSAKKSVSDASKAPSLDLSPNSSDSEHSDKDNKESEVDDTIVILSEDIVEVTKPEENSLDSNKRSKDSDSDNDICVVSQSSPETRTIAPRRTNVNLVPKTKNPVPVISRVPGFRTSNPNQRPGEQMKRKASNQFVNGVRKKFRNSGFPTSQATIPQVINGAMRKTVVTKVPRCKPTSSPDSIPLIELD